MNIEDSQEVIEMIDSDMSFQSNTILKDLRLKKEQKKQQLQKNSIQKESNQLQKVANINEQNNEENNLKLNKQQSIHVDIEQLIQQQKEQEEIEKASMELIKKMQEEDLKLMEERREKRKLEDQQDVICSICFGEFEYDGKEVYMEGCEHMYHDECFRDHLITAIETRDCKKIVCPEESCEQAVIVDNYQNLITREQYNNYQKYSLQNYVDTHGDEVSWCPTADCEYVFVQSEDPNSNNFICPKCEKHYCLSCKAVYHKDMTCKEYEITHKRDENDVKFDKYLKGKKFKQCSNCKAIVSKNQGCNHMTCRCGYQFCYVCGGKHMHCECVKKQLEIRQRQIEQQRLNRSKSRGRGNRGRGRR